MATIKVINQLEPNFSYTDSIKGIVKAQDIEVTTDNTKASLSNVLATHASDIAKSIKVDQYGTIEDLNTLIIDGDLQFDQGFGHTFHAGDIDAQEIYIKDSLSGEALPVASQAYVNTKAASVLASATDFTAANYLTKTNPQATGTLAVNLDSDSLPSGLGLYVGTGKVQINDSTKIAGKLEAMTDALVSGDLTVSKNVMIDQTIAVDGDATFRGYMSVSSDLIVTGNISAANITIASDATVYGSPVVTVAKFASIASDNSLAHLSDFDNYYNKVKVNNSISEAVSIAADSLTTIITDKASSINTATAATYLTKSNPTATGTLTIQSLKIGNSASANLYSNVTDVELNIDRAIISKFAKIGDSPVITSSNLQTVLESYPTYADLENNLSSFKDRLVLPTVEPNQPVLGSVYLCTTLTPPQPIFYDGTNWCDFTGASLPADAAWDSIPVTTFASATVPAGCTRRYVEVYNHTAKGRASVTRINEDYDQYGQSYFVKRPQAQDSTGSEYLELIVPGSDIYSTTTEPNSETNNKFLVENIKKEIEPSCSIEVFNPGIMGYAAVGYKIYFLTNTPKFEITCYTSKVQPTTDPNTTPDTVPPLSSDVFQLNICEGPNPAPNSDYTYEARYFQVIRIGVGGASETIATLTPQNTTITCAVDSQITGFSTTDYFDIVTAGTDIPAENIHALLVSEASSCTITQTDPSSYNNTLSSIGYRLSDVRAGRVAEVTVTCYTGVPVDTDTNTESNSD